MFDIDSQQEKWKMSHPHQHLI